jgi:hypothetical protein
LKELEGGANAVFEKPRLLARDPILRPGDRIMKVEKRTLALEVWRGSAELSLEREGINALTIGRIEYRARRPVLRGFSWGREPATVHRTRDQIARMLRQLGFNSDLVLHTVMEGKKGHTGYSLRSPLYLGVSHSSQRGTRLVFFTETPAGRTHSLATITGGNELVWRSGFPLESVTSIWSLIIQARYGTRVGKRDIVLKMMEQLGFTPGTVELTLGNAPTEERHPT